MVDQVRHLRQLLLPEIGLQGQERIDRAVATVGGESLAHEVASAYARGAGFRGVVGGCIDVDRLAPAALVTRSAPREVLAGSRAALAAIRAALGG